MFELMPMSFVRIHVSLFPSTALPATHFLQVSASIYCSVGLFVDKLSVNIDYDNISWKIIFLTSEVLKISSLLYGKQVGLKNKIYACVNVITDNQSKRITKLN